VQTKLTLSRDRSDPSGSIHKPAAWSNALAENMAINLLRLFISCGRTSNGCAGIVGTRRMRCSSVTHRQTSHPPRQRNQSNFSTIATSIRGPATQDLSYFRSILSSNQIVTTLDNDSQDEMISPYNIDWTNRYHGQSTLVLKPSFTSQVSDILSYCHSKRLAVVPRGGNTGLCGGATPITNEIVLSLENMNNIHSLDGQSGIVVADAGCILQTLQEYTAERGYLLPLDIGSKGSCQIGGNVATNAGGCYFNRFGGLHGTVCGMEVVLPQGQVIKLNLEGSDNIEGYGGCHRKDNTGYDLKHLFIGAEGTLGVITKVAMACPRLPNSKNVALLICESYAAVLEVLAAAKEELGEVLSAMELMDWSTLSLVQQHMSNKEEFMILNEILRFEGSQNQAPLYLLVETQGSNAEHDLSKMDSFQTRLFESSIISNGYIATDSKRIGSFWNIRESCNPSVALDGYVYKYDVSVPIEDYMEVAAEVKECLSSKASFPLAKVCVWGHLADGNAHVNVVTPGLFDKDEAFASYVDEAVYGSVLKRKGSISAEHGIGQSKRDILKRVKDKSALDVMVQLKAMFDPRGIMNPGKVLLSEGKSATSFDS
jgi:FAD/FMN-containing dehydrogenase